MELRLEPDSGTPIYLQLAQGLREAIASGALPPGAEVPSSRALAAANRVNYHTVNRALALLEDDGLLERRRGDAYRVVDGAGPPARLRLLDDAIDELLRLAAGLGVSGGELVQRLRSKLGKGGVL